MPNRSPANGWSKTCRGPALGRRIGLRPQYLTVKEKAETITAPHLVLDTGALSLEDCVQRSLDYLNKACLAARIPIGHVLNLATIYLVFRLILPPR